MSNETPVKKIFADEDSNIICHGSLTDWHSDAEIALNAALNYKHAWTTEWYSNSSDVTETAARLTDDGEGTLEIEVWVLSDDSEIEHTESVSDVTPLDLNDLARQVDNVHQMALRALMNAVAAAAPSELGAVLSIPETLAAQLRALSPTARSQVFNALDEIGSYFEIDLDALTFEGVQVARAIGEQASGQQERHFSYTPAGDKNMRLKK